nr:hypothetical protein CFP56_06248 [Quercus suber]
MGPTVASRWPPHPLSRCHPLRLPSPACSVIVVRLKVVPSDFLINNASDRNEQSKLRRQVEDLSCSRNCYRFLRNHSQGDRIRPSALGIPFPTHS